jgi:hypothetical protein
VRGQSTTAARKEREGSALRELFVDGNGAVLVESVLVEGLANAFPIRPDSASSCGQPGDFVAATDVCAATEIARFWGLPSG